MRVAWIGLGAMGQPMALAAQRAGHQVHGHARRPTEQGILVEAGATVTDRLPDILSGAEIACITLFSEAQIRDEVIAGGVIEALPTGAILAVHSTVGAPFMRDLATRRTDIAVLDAGFSGGPDEALAGQLTLMVGGDAAALDRARPVFSAYAGHIAHLGPVGSGMTLKVINNLMFAAHVAIAQDALRLVRDGGLALDVAVATLLRGSAGSNALGFLGRAPDADTMVGAIRPYLEKDVPIARAMTGGSDLGALDAATARFTISRPTD